MSPVTEHLVQVNFLESISGSEGEREVHVVENIRLVPVCAPTPGLSHLSLAQRLGVNFELWRNNSGMLDGDQSGSKGQAGVSPEVRWVIQGSCQGYCLMTYWCSEDCGERVGRGYNG